MEMRSTHTRAPAGRRLREAEIISAFYLASKRSEGILIFTSYARSLTGISSIRTSAPRRSNRGCPVLGRRLAVPISSAIPNLTTGAAMRRPKKRSAGQRMCAAACPRLLRLDHLGGQPANRTTHAERLAGISSKLCFVLCLVLYWADESCRVGPRAQWVSRGAGDIGTGVSGPGLCRGGPAAALGLDRPFRAVHQRDGGDCQRSGSTSACRQRRGFVASAAAAACVAASAG